MTQVPPGSGPGYSPGTSDDVTVTRGDDVTGGDDVAVAGGEETIDAPVQDGAQQLREEAAESRAEGMESRADNPQAPGESAEQATQTEVLDPDIDGDDSTRAR